MHNIDAIANFKKNLISARRYPLTLRAAVWTIQTGKASAEKFLNVGNFYKLLRDATN